MNFVFLVLALALIQYIVFGFLVGHARIKYEIQAPAVTGHPIFERYYRVQMNTLELLVPFVPALLIASHFWGQISVAAIGVFFIIGRGIYAYSYIKNPSSRAVGFIMSMLVVVGLLLASLLGVIKSSFMQFYD